MIPLLTTSALGCKLLQKGPRKAYARARTEGRIPFDAIIVPGVPYADGGWGSVMKLRVLWSWVLYRNGYTRNVIYSGGAVYTHYTEARIMGLYGAALGIPRAHIFFDTWARHSTENVYYSYLLARELGFKTLALATDPAQSFLLKRFIRRRFASPVYHLPVVLDALKAYYHLNPVIDPQSCRSGNWTSIKKQESFWQRFKGTLGKNIDFSQYPGGKVGVL